MLDLRTRKVTWSVQVLGVEKEVSGVGAGEHSLQMGRSGWDMRNF